MKIDTLNLEKFDGPFRGRQKDQSRFGSEDFDPAKHWKDKKYLDQLRSTGALRKAKLLRAVISKFSQEPPYKFAHLESGAMGALRWFTWKTTDLTVEEDRRDSWMEGKSFIDFGCGLSPDADIAHLLGAKKTLAVDIYYTRRKDPFMMADVTKRLDVKARTFDYVCSQAMVDLIQPYKRHKMYREAYRLLRKHGMFAINFQPLSRGWGMNVDKECDDIMGAGFEYLGSSYNHIKVFVKM